MLKSVKGIGPRERRRIDVIRKRGLEPSRDLTPLDLNLKLHRQQRLGRARLSCRSLLNCRQKQKR